MTRIRPNSGGHWGWLAVAICCFAAAPRTWAADRQPIEFHIATGPLDKMLLQIAKQGRLVLSFDAALTRGMTGHAVEGTMTAKEALADALDGSRLELIDVADGTLTLRASEAAHDAGRPAPADHVLPKIAVLARADESDATGRSFVVDRSSTATRTDMALSDVPQSVGAISREVMTSQQASSVADALGNVSGVTSLYGFNNANYDVKVRGFQTTALMVDGMIYESNAYPPLEEIDRVEVVKGPVTLLAGGVPAGGIVNAVTKKPEFEKHATLTTQIDSSGQRRASADIGGTFGDGSPLGYRFIAGTELDHRNYGGYDGEREAYLAPSLRYRDAATDITLGVEHHRNRLPILPYTIIGIDGNPLPDTPLTPVSAPSDHVSNNSTEVHLLAEHSFGDGWTVRARARLMRWETETWWDLPVFAFDSPGDVALDAIDARTVQHQATVASELVRKFKLGGVSGTLLGGVDFWRFGYTNDQAPDNFSLQNLYAPQPLPTIPGGPLAPLASFDARQWSAYMQAQLAFGARLHVLASLRHTNVLLHQIDDDDFDRTRRVQDHRNRHGHATRVIRRIPCIGQLVVLEDHPEFSRFQIGKPHRDDCAQTAEHREVPKRNGAHLSEATFGCMPPAKHRDPELNQTTSSPSPLRESIISEIELKLIPLNSVRLHSTWSQALPEWPISEWPHRRAFQD